MQLDALKAAGCEKVFTDKASGTKVDRAGLAEALAIYMQSSGAMVIPNEVFIALPYVLTIVLTIARKSFNVPARLGIPYRKEN